MTDDHPAKETWYRLIDAAKAAFRAGRLAQALDGFNRAIAAIDAELEGIRPDATLLMAKVASHHNRSATLARMGVMTQAEADCRHAHAFVSAILHDPHTPATLRATACCLSRMTRVEWDQLRAQAPRTSIAAPPDDGIEAPIVHAQRGGASHVRH